MTGVGRETDAAVPTGGLRWTLVVPLKPAREAKSRLAAWLDPGPRRALVRAMAADTLAAAAAAQCVDRIVVVTGDRATAQFARRAAGALVDVVREPEPAGLNPAIRAGIARARHLAPWHGVGVLLGDLPALRAADLDDALAQAAHHRLGLATDACGKGTTLLTAAPGARMDPAFGPGSAQAHRARGHVRVIAAPGLTHDVDVPADLAAVLALGVGPRTRRVAGDLALPG